MNEFNTDRKFIVKYPKVKEYLKALEYCTYKNEPEIKLFNMILLSAYIEKESDSSKYFFTKGIQTYINIIKGDNYDS